MTYNRWTSGRCRFCNEPLTDQEYHAGDEECRYAALERMRAALARAEAAEAERDDLHRQLAELAAVMEEIEAERLALAARVAELEAQQAAQEWRPVSDVPDHEEVELLVRGYIGDDGKWYYRDGIDPMRGWRPLPPAPQEPTP